MTIYDKNTLLFCYSDLTARIYPKSMPLKINDAFFFAGIVITDSEGQPVAACVLYRNENLHFEGEVAYCFGHFEALNDAVATQQLLQEALALANQQHVNLLIGPMNGSTWDNYRVATDNFEYKYVLDFEHPPYYAALLESVAQCHVLSTYHTKIDCILAYDVEKCQRAEALFHASKLRVRNIDLTNYEAELSRIYQFCMVSFHENLLFTPLAEAVFIEKYRPLKSFLQEKYILIAEDNLGEIKGLMFAIPDFINPTEKGIVLKTLARSPDNQYVGLGTYLGKLLYDQMKIDQFKYAIHAFMEQSNISNNLSRSFSGVTIKNYKLYYVKNNEHKYF